MKILKRIIIWILVLILLLIGVAYLLPGSYKIERSTLIKSDGEMIYSMVCDFHNWEHWTPWSFDDDTTAVEEIIGNCEVGSINRWDGEEMGKGEMKVTELIAGQKIMWDLGFEGFSQKMIINMYFEPEGDDWVVTWTAEGDLGYNPMYRYYGLLLDSDLGADFEKGLQQLKDFCESLPDYPGIEIVEVASMPSISVKDSVPAADLGVFMETYMPQLYMYALRQEASMEGHPYSVYYNWDPEGMVLVEIGLPLEESIEGEGVIMASMTPGGKAVKAAYYGPYEEMAIVYEALEKYITVMQLEAVGHAWEIYVTDPGSEPDSSKLETIVYFAIK